MKGVVTWLILLLLLGPSGFVAGAELQNQAEYLPKLRLPVPGNQADRDYLGLTGKTGEGFTFSDIKADILLIELFSMYCPYCQKAAPRVNELYARMDEIGQSGPVVKIIGLGASNSPFEVDYFMDTYHIDFPLFADRDRSMYGALAGAGTPTFIGCRLQIGGKSTIVLRRAGVFSSADGFLAELIEKAGF